MTDNALVALRVLDDEDVISNLLAYGVNHSPSFAAAFVAAVLGGQADHYDKFRACLRPRVPDVGVPDLVLKAALAGCCDLIIIENKIMAEEGKDQLDGYTKKACIQYLRQTLEERCPTGEWHNTYFVFLTLYPWQKPRNRQFMHITYKDILPGISLCQREQNSLADRLFRDLCDAYSAFYASGDTDDDDVLLEKWSSKEDQKACGNAGLDARFLHFGNVFASQKMKYPLALKAGQIARQSKTGRLYYLAQISKDGWVSSDTAERAGFNIHFEPQFHPLSGRFVFHLHYELNPYRPKAQARNKLASDQLNRYIAERNRFQEHLGMKRPLGLIQSNAWNQVGTVSVKLDQRTRFDEFPDVVSSAIAPIAKVIDDLLLR
jgi:hypothetical protein